MRTTLIILTIIFLSGCNNSNKKIEIPENDWNQAITSFKELQETLKNENAKTWNHSLDGPLMLINRETRTIIANESDNSGELVKRGNFFVEKLPENINVANTAFDWNGKRWTMVALPLPENKQERLNLLIHES